MTNMSDADIIKDVQNSVVDAPKVAPDEGKKPDETPAESKKEENKGNKADETPAEEKKPETPPAEKPEEKKEVIPEKKERPERFIPQDQYNKRKEKWEADMKAKDEAYAKLEADKKALESKLAEAADPNLSKTEKKEVGEELKTLADEIGLTPEQLEKMQKTFLKGVKTEMSEEDRKLLDSVRVKSKEDEQARLEREEKEYFNKEWTEVLPDVEKTFPNATPEKRKEAMGLMDQLAHTTKYKELSLKEILVLNQADFEKILAVPKRKTFEGSDNGIAPVEDTDLSTMNISDMTPKQLARYEKEYRDKIPKETTQISRNGIVTME